MQITPELFDKALLKPGREKFVELFLERETILLHEYINYKKLLDLFNNVANPDFICQICLEGVLAKSPVSTVHIRKLLNFDLGQVHEHSDQGHFFILIRSRSVPITLSYIFYSVLRFINHFIRSNNHFTVMRVTAIVIIKFHVSKISWFAVLSYFSHWF